MALVKGHWGNGSGFLIQPNLVVTNHHVVEDEMIRHLRILFPDAPPEHRGQYHPTLLFEDPERDIAVLRVDARLKPIQAAPRESFQRGLSVLVIGNPGLGGAHVLRNAVSQGVLSSDLFLEGQRYYQLGISVNPGNSGGPVLDLQGRALGIVVTKAAHREGIAFCIPIHEVEDGVRSARTASPRARQELQASHRLRVFAGRLGYVSKAYDGLMKIYVEAMHAPYSRGQDINVGMAVVEPTVTRRWRRSRGDRSGNFETTGTP